MRIFVAGRWHQNFPFTESWGHAFRYYGEVAMVPFPWHGGRTPRGSFEEIIRTYQPKVLFLDGSYLGESDLSYDFLSELKLGGVKLVARPREPTLGEGWVFWPKILSLMNFTYAASPVLIDEIRKLGIENVRFLPAEADPEFYYPLSAKKEIEILFLGFPLGGRVPALKLLDQEFDLWVGGGQHIDCGFKHHFWGAFGKHFNEWNSKAKIGLCIEKESTKNFKIPFTARLVNTMVGGTFVLAEYISGIENFFNRKEHLDWYETSEELVELARFWLGHGDQREEVAQEGRRFVLNNYTYRHNVEKILRDLGLDI